MKTYMNQEQSAKFVADYLKNLISDFDNICEVPMVSYSIKEEKKYRKRC